MEAMAQQGGHPTLGDFFYGSVTVGERGQVVIPAEARKAHNVQPGDKLLVFRHPYIRGLMLAKVDDVRAMSDELQQWEAFVARLADEAEEETESE
jgi:AbrB family looped-hinge helix DNA binding protein